MISRGAQTRNMLSCHPISILEYQQILQCYEIVSGKNINSTSGWCGLGQWPHTVFKMCLHLSPSLSLQADRSYTGKLVKDPGNIHLSKNHLARRKSV